MRKPKPENIYIARRTAHFRRLTDVYRLDELDAEHWLAAWEREARGARAGPLLPDVRPMGEEWVTEQRARR